MQYKPHHYQEIATAMIVNHPYCALLLDMGLGKRFPRSQRLTCSLTASRLPAS